MADKEDLMWKFIDIGFKANGAALTIAVVAASNLLKGSAVPPAVTVVPSCLFLLGLILAYTLATANTAITVHFGNLDTLLQIRDTIANIELSNHRTEETARILAESIESKGQIEAALLTKKKLIDLQRAASWLINGSLLSFVAGVIWAIVAISISQPGAATPTP